MRDRLTQDFWHFSRAWRGQRCKDGFKVGYFRVVLYKHCLNVV